MAEENKTQKPKFNEILHSQSPLFESSQLEPFNPDKLFQKRGNYDIYDEMREDDQCKSVLETKKTLALNAGWELQVSDEDNKLIEIRDQIEQWLKEDMVVGFDFAIKEMLTCLDYGFSISEPIWMIQDGQIKLKNLKTRAPHSFEIHTDSFGNIEKVLQWINGGIIEIPLGRIIIHTYQMEFGNWYGKSDLRAAYRPWWSKEFALKAWNIYLEKFAAPTPVFKYGATNADKETTDKLLEIGKRLQTSTSIVIPEDIDVEFMDSNASGSRGGENYEAAIDKHNLMISRSMLAPDLLGLGGSETSGGSFALGERHFEMFFMVIQDIRKNLELIINRNIIKPLVDFNFIVDEYPIFKFMPINERIKVEMLKIWIEAVKGVGYIASEEEINWARKITGAPEGEVERKQEILNPINQENQNGGDENATQKRKEEKINPSESKKDDDKEEKVFVLENSPTMAEKRTSFTKVQKRLDQLEDKHTASLAGTIGLMKEDLINRIEKGKFIENKRLDKVNDLTLKFTNQLRLGIKSMLVDSFKLGNSDAKELFKPKKKQFIDVTEAQIIDEVVNNSPVFTEELIEEDILKQAKLTLKESITTGQSLQETKKQLAVIFEPYDPLFNGARLENIIRTNTLKVYNQSKQSYFQPFVDSGDIAAFLYSAIIDGRQTQFCEDHNGKIYLANDPYVESITPPNHFQCRSTFIPVTQDELEDNDIFGATEEENKEFFEDGKFKESKKFESKYKRQPGGFFVEQKS